MASFCTTLQPCLLEAVAGTEDDSAIGVSHETQGSGFAHTMLVDFIFEQVHTFESNIKMIGYSIKNTGIKLCPVQCPNRETERTAAAGVRTAGEVLCTEGFTPRVTHPRGQAMLFVVQGEVVSSFREIQQTSFDADIAKDGQSPTRGAVHDRSTAEVLDGVVCHYTETRRPAQLVFKI